MRRIVIFALAGALLAIATAGFAVSVHWKKGSPQFEDLGLQLREFGTVAGVGGGDVLVQLTATADVDATCGNPGKNEEQAPGQNPAPITVTGAQPISEQEIKNGNLSYDVKTDAPASTISGAPDCPNSSWTERINDLLFTSAQLTIRQDTNGSADPADPATYEAVVFSGASAKCTFDPHTSDGDVAAGDFSCPRR